jgi:hypothetical protein
MFGFARRRRFLEYDYVPLVVDSRRVYDEEDDSEEDALASQGGGEDEVMNGSPREEALDAADDRERVALPAL